MLRSLRLCLQTNMFLNEVLFRMLIRVVTATGKRLFPEEPNYKGPITVAEILKISHTASIGIHALYYNCKNTD
jgi:hypothetical protein